MSIIGIIISGLVVGFIARLISPAPNNPTGFIMTCILGIVGAFLATYIGQAIGWYRIDQGAGWIASIIGAIIVLAIWHMIMGRRYTAGAPGPRRWL